MSSDNPNYEQQKDEINLLFDKMNIESESSFQISDNNNNFNNINIY